MACRGVQVVSFDLHRRSGPFFALEDGNAMLSELGHGLVFAETHAPVPGRYVVWRAGHFVALWLRDNGRVTVKDGAALQAGIA
jgi:hypothetical protein